MKRHLLSFGAAAAALFCGPLAAQTVLTVSSWVPPSHALSTAQRGILLGVTRRAVLRLARGEGMSIEYRSPHVDEKFSEAFLTSSSRGVVPIVSIDGEPVGQGRVGEWTKMLSKAYQAYVKERSEKIDR